MELPHPRKVNSKTEPLLFWVISLAGLIDDLVAVLTLGRFTSKYRLYLLAGKSRSFTKWKNKREEKHNHGLRKD